MNIKKFNRKISLIMMLSGILLLGSGLFLGGRAYLVTADLNDFSFHEQPTVSPLSQEKQQLLSAIDHVIIEVDNSSIAVLPSNEAHASLSYQTPNGEKPSGEISFEEVEDTLFIRTKQSNKKTNWVDLSFIKFLFQPESVNVGQPSLITLSIPKEKKLEELEINMVNGTINVQERQIKKATYHLETGNIQLAKNAIDQLEIDTASGTIETIDSHLSSADIHSETGQLFFDQTTIGRGELLTESGAIALNASHFIDTSIRTESGKISGKQMTFTGDTTMHTELGDLALELTKETLDNTHFSLQTELGKMALPELNGQFRKQSFESTGDYSDTLTAVTESGDILIQSKF